MRPRHVVLINCVFIGLMLISAGTVYQFMTGVHPLDAIHFGRQKSGVVAVTAACTDKKPLNLSTAHATGLVKLAAYQQACHSFATDTMMVFVSMPPNTTAAVAYAKQDAATLEDFSQHGIRPLVIAEPSDQNGNNLDFGAFASGTYSSAINAYFTQLKSSGVTGRQLGIWNPFPEANLPYWKNNLPQYFAPDVNLYLNILRSYFPTAQTSIMLNSATYNTTDFDWANGEYDSLLPYVKGITPGLVNYAGLQGFPWQPQQGGAGAILNATEFLSPDLLSEMADALGTKNVWFNTGTYAAKYILSPKEEVTMSPDRRSAVLTTVDNEALVLQKRGYNVNVNIFAQDKSNTSEETDWSYWHNGQPFSSTATPVITNFINELGTQHIGLWLFDN